MRGEENQLLELKPTVAIKKKTIDPLMPTLYGIYRVGTDIYIPRITFYKTPVAKIDVDISLAIDFVKCPFIQLASFTASVSVIYPTSVGDKAIMCSIIASQLHAHPCIINPYLVIDLPMTVIDLPMA
ncbi:hypothetical protein Tco_1316115 [Tanacetum coccineum]